MEFCKSILISVDSTTVATVILYGLDNLVRFKSIDLNKLEWYREDKLRLYSEMRFFYIY